MADSGLDPPDRRRPSEAAERHRRQNHHPAVHDVMATMGKASRDLDAVQRHLDLEFRNSYPDHVNPVKLVSRIKRIQEEVASLKELCRELLTEKQELIDKARASLVGQRSSIQRLLASSGLPLMGEADEAAYTNLSQIIDEWTAQVRAKTGEEKDEDINQMLFSAIVQNN